MKTTILMDINLLPSEYKSTKEGIKDYEKDFDVKLIPYDSSKSNIAGAFNNIPKIIKIAE